MAKNTNVKKQKSTKEQKFVKAVKTGKFANVAKVPVKYIRISTVAQPYETYQNMAVYHSISQ